MSKNIENRPHQIKWDQLSINQQKDLLVVTQRIVKRESLRLQARFGDNVLGIAEGFRTKGKQKKTLRELVVRVYVKNKWSKDRKLKVGEIPIPTYFAGFLQKGNKRIKIQIPTDINVFNEIEIQRAYVDVTTENYTEFGSICCLVRDKKYKSLFILSCKHVFGLTSKSDSFAGRTNVKIDLCGLGEKYEFVAHISRDNDLSIAYPDQNIFSLDAAIARVDNTEAVSSRINNFRATMTLDDFENVKFGDVLRIPARSGTIKATVVSKPKSMRFPYRCNGVKCYLRFRRVIEYKTSPSTQPGDSGSALLNGTILVGMHFAFNISTGHGYAMFSKDVICRSTFGRDIELVSDHNVT